MRVKQFLVGINNQFGATPFIIALAILIIAVFFLFLYVSYYFQQKRMKENRLRTADELYTKLAARLSLTPSQEELLDTLSQYTRQPQMKYRLILDEHIFNRAVREYNKEHQPNPSVPPLRHTIGFKHRDASPAEKNIVSTAQLMEGQELLIKNKKYHGQLKGMINGIQTDGFTVSLTPSIFLETGAALEFSFHNSRGQYSGKSYVRARSGEGDAELYLLAHCEHLVKTQLRQFYRRPYTRPCTVEYLGHENRSLQSSFVELGGGGATIRDSAEIFSPGDIVSMRWNTEKSVLITLGRVLRITRRKHSGRCIHVRFEGLNEKKRDALIRELLHREQNKLIDEREISPSRSATRDST